MSEVNHADRAHSDLGASSTERWMNCPASVGLSKDMPNEESEYARVGTIAHELSEYCIEEAKDPLTYIGKKFQDYLVDEDMAEAVKVYVDFVNKEMEGDEKILFLEERFHLSEIDEELFGTNDACVYEPFGTLHIIDYKHGQGVPVEAVENTQLLYYAVGASMGLDFTEVKLTVVQPRCPHEAGPIRTYTTTPERLEKFKVELREAVDRTREENPSFGPTEKGCRFCRAKSKCPELKKKALEVAKVEFDDVGEPSLPEVSSLDINDIVKVLKVANLIEPWIKEVQKRAYLEAESGTKIEGHKLVKKKSNRKWTDAAKVVDELSMIMDEADMYKKTLLTPAQLEKVVGKETISALCHKPDTGTTLVPLTDKRKEVLAITASDEFSELDEL